MNKIPSVVQVGTIINTVQKSPEGYLKCDGQTISADEYPELCSHLQPSYTYYNSSAAFMLPAEFKDREDYVVFSDTLCAVVYNNDIYVANKANMSNYSSYTKKTAMSFVSKVDTTGLSINNAYVSGIYYSKALNMFAFRLNYQRFMETTTQSYMIFTYDFNNIASSYASSLGYGRFDGNYVHGVYNNSHILYGACSSTASEEYVQYGRQLPMLGNSNYSALAAVSFVINNKVVLNKDISNYFIILSYRQIGNYIKNTLKQTNGEKVFLVTQNKFFFERALDLKNEKYITYCVAYSIIGKNLKIIDY